jgi:hypothetical protein
MNAQNAHEYLPLVQAIADGKKIQLSYKTCPNDWYDADEIDFFWEPSLYRIKPEPRTFEMWLDKDTGCLSTDELIREFGHVRFDSLERITVVEVLE